MIGAEEKALLRQALDSLAADDYRPAAGWERAHTIAQAREGSPLFDRLHALCHRIEGDEDNARYWYRRAATEPFDGTLSQEAAALGRALEGNDAR